MAALATPMIELVLKVAIVALIGGVVWYKIWKERKRRK